MMGKIAIFSLLWWVTGNPFVAAVVLLIVLYALERRFVGLTPGVTAPIKRNRRLAKLKQELRLQPHWNSGKLETAMLLIEKKRYAEALRLLEEVRPVMDDSAEVPYAIGLCLLKLGETAEGERAMLDAVAINPRVKYGEPYLRLAEAFAESDPNKALGYLERFREIHSSSCEAYYRLARVYERLGRQTEAKRAYAETVDIYRGLPKYKRRSERRWALLAKLKGG